MKLKTTPYTVPSVTPYSVSGKDFTDREHNRTTHSILLIKGTYHRHAVCFTPEDGECRRDHGEPVLPGPYASTFGLCSSIDNRPAEVKRLEREEEDSRTIIVEDGTILNIGGLAWSVTIYRREYIKLTLIGPEGAETRKRVEAMLKFAKSHDWGENAWDGGDHIRVLEMGVGSKYFFNMKELRDWAGY